MSCCIPNCINKLHGWTTEFPRDEKLLARWKAAIFVGTGHQLPDDNMQGASICNLHFLLPELTPGGRDEGYLEPVLFIRDCVQLQVASCRLCLRYETVDCMFKVEDCLVDGFSLQWMASTYFGTLLSTAESPPKGYLCEQCTVRIDITHAFWQDISYGANEYQMLLQRMMDEKVVFRYSGQDYPIKTESLLTEKAVATPQILTKENVSVEGHSFSITVKEEPQFTASDLSIAEELSVSSNDNTPEGSSNEQMPSERKKQSGFKCYICETNLESKAALMQHLLIDHKAEESYSCHKCNMSFNKITSFNLHLSRHDAVKPFKCSVCSLRFSRSTAKTYHEAALHGIEHGNEKRLKKAEKTQECLTCGKTYLYKSQLKQHEMVQHRGEAVIKCEICEKSFASLRNLQRHLVTHRSEMPLATRNGGGSRNIPKCNVCHETFNHSKEIVAHFSDVHPDASLKIYPCTECDEVFFIEHSLTSHRYIHSDTFACDQCGKRHYSSASLGKHRYSVHGVRLSEDQYVKCPVCDKEFVRDANYSRHLATHDEEKQFSCEFCDKRFRLSDQLRIHHRTHSTASERKSLTCVNCGSSFSAPSSLSRHKKKCMGKQLK